MNTAIRSIRSIRQYIFNPWKSGVFIIALLVAAPLFVIAFNIFQPGDEAWGHISGNLLPGYTLNTVLLMAGVAFFSLIIGVSNAWIVSAFTFPGRKLLSWFLIFPFAIPAYITGFTWAGILDFTSPVYLFFRNYLDINTGQYLFFDILSLPGAIFIFTVAYYPYVYLISLAWFTKQSPVYREVAASLGKSSTQTFFSVALPMARPAIVAGISLVLMEVLNDYGLVHYFGVNTFTTGIFTAWYAFGSPPSALKLSAVLMLFVIVLIFSERWQRRNKKFTSTASPGHKAVRKKVGPVVKVALIIWMLLPFAAGFLFPLLMQLHWLMQTWDTFFNRNFTDLVINSSMLAVVASLAVVVLSLVISFSVRTWPVGINKTLSRLATLGYAIPGAVVAVGILSLLLWTGNQLGDTAGGVVRTMLTASWAALIYAYAVRFMAVGYNSIESGLDKVPLSMDESARSLGISNAKTLRKINLPLIRPAVWTGLLLVFIDVLKELPLTLILRPFNFDTLAIRAFEFASDERIAEAAPASLVLVVIGLLPVILINKLSQFD